jgi:hypothetical protein
MFDITSGVGGARRDRTADLLRAKQALSQLSYGPAPLVGLGGFEPPTSPLSGVRSDQLSYRPMTGLKQDQVTCADARA